jgi:hypothetical protein
MKEGVNPKKRNEPAQRASRRSPVSSDEDGHCAKQSQLGIATMKKRNEPKLFT